MYNFDPHYFVIITQHENLDDRQHICIVVIFHRDNSRTYFFMSLLSTYVHFKKKMYQLAMENILVGNLLNTENRKELVTGKSKALVNLMKADPYNLLYFCKNEEHLLFPRREGQTLYKKIIWEKNPYFCAEGHRCDHSVCCITPRMKLKQKNSGCSNEQHTLMYRCNQTASSSRMTNTFKATSFTKNFAIGYHYTEAQFIPVLKGGFIWQKDGTCCLEKTNKFSMEEFDKLSPNMLESEWGAENSSLNMCLIVNTTMEKKFLSSSLQVIETNNEHFYHREPLVYFWLNDKKKLNILFQSFFHAFTDELVSHKRDVDHEVQYQVFQSILPIGIALVIKIRGRNEYVMRFVDQVFWLEVFTERGFFAEDFPLLQKMVHNCSLSVLSKIEQPIFGELQCPNTKNGIRKYDIAIESSCSAASISKDLQVFRENQSIQMSDHVEDKKTSRIFWMICTQLKG